MRDIDSEGARPRTAQDCTVYLDHAATTPMLPEAVTAVSAALGELVHRGAVLLGAVEVVGQRMARCDRRVDQCTADEITPAEDENSHSGS